MKKWIVCCTFALISVFSGAQVKISADGSTPDNSAGLEVDFADKGFLPPRLTTEQRDAIANPAQGLQIYNLTTKCVEVYIGSFWQNMFCGCEEAPANLSYSQNGPLIYCLNVAIAPNLASTAVSTAGMFTVSPGLPAGLILNHFSGAISGTPVALIQAEDYTITASNACGSTDRVLSIAVQTPPASAGSITGLSAPTLGSTATYSVGAVASASSYQWSVPAGWSITSGQGSTSIEVTVGATPGNISVIAENQCGTSAATQMSVTPWRPVAATGGEITTYTGDGTNGLSGVEYRVHAFTSPGASSWVVTDAGTDAAAELMVVAGGGGGGGSTGSYEGGGGGGAGGLIQQSLAVLTDSYAIQVGAGGSGGGPDSFGADGGNSSFAAVLATGGGGGAKGEPGVDHNGRPGGSGGGGARAGTGGAGTAGQGSTGGNAGGMTYQWGAGGGGGKNASGQNAVGTNNGGAGGSGYNAAGLFSTAFGASGWFAGGGGAGGTNGLNGLSGGAGGGGNGGNFDQNGNPAITNSGGGGGGAGGNGKSGGNGGNGLVIIKYPLTNPNPM